MAADRDYTTFREFPQRIVRVRLTDFGYVSGNTVTFVSFGAEGRILTLSCPVKNSNMPLPTFADLSFDNEPSSIAGLSAVIRNADGTVGSELQGQRGAISSGSALLDPRC